jgi:putative DNA primase/helicase
MPRRALGGDRSAIMGELLAQEYGVVFDQAKRLARYLTELGTDITDRYTVTTQTGWVNGSFVLPDRTIGDQSLKFGNPEETTAGKLKTGGTVESWQQSVGAKCEGNSRLIFGVGAALAGPMTPVFEIESGGFHLVGATSTGKTSTLTVAGSIMGLTTADIPSWHTTANGLEGIAAEHNHLLLPLDEIGQADPRGVGSCAYLLGNGAGKTRMSKTLVTRKPKTWQLLTLSSGELGLGEYLKQAGITQKGGQEVRMPDIPAVPQGSKHGVFETIHGYSSAADFVTQLEADCRGNRGAVLTACLERLVTDRANPDWVKQWRQRLWEIVAILTADIADAAIGRVAKRFALVQIALEIAYGYGLLPFPIEQAAWAVKTLFRDWVDNRGGAGSIEVKNCLERIEAEFVKNQHSDRIFDVDRPPSEPIRNLLAYRKTDVFTQGHEFWVPTPVFRELTAGVDRELVTAELQRRGWLLGPDSDGKTALTRQTQGKKMRVYVFTRFWDGSEDHFPLTLKTSVPGVPGVLHPETSSETAFQEEHPGTHPKNGGVPGVPQSLPENNQADPCIFSGGGDGTPRTPGKNEVFPSDESQNLDGEVVPGDGTPRTPRTPEKHDIPENEGQNSNDVDDDWEGDY